MSVGQPQIGIGEASDLRLMRIGAGAKSEPGRGLAGAAQSRKQRLGAPGNAADDVRSIRRSNPTVSVELPAMVKPFDRCRI